jgi:DNA-directed RNA polymerase specialized sigma24 family protein
LDLVAGHRADGSRPNWRLAIANLPAVSKLLYSEQAMVLLPDFHVRAGRWRSCTHLVGMAQRSARHITGLLDAPPHALPASGFSSNRLHQNFAGWRSRAAESEMAARELSTSKIKALMRVAARYSRIPHEAEDLVQDVLLSVIEKNRDCGDPSFLPWASGAIRNCARLAARTAARRKRREYAYAVEHDRSGHSLPRFPDTFIATLPRSRRVVALLINLGMGRREIVYLLGLSDMAMRQRIAGVRKAFADFAGEVESDHHASFPANGLARRALKASLPKCRERRFAVRDPDGLPIFFSARGHVSNVGGNRQGEPLKEHPHAD